MQPGCVTTFLEERGKDVGSKRGQGENFHLQISVNKRKALQVDFYTWIWETEIFRWPNHQLRRYCPHLPLFPTLWACREDADSVKHWKNYFQDSFKLSYLSYLRLIKLSWNTFGLCQINLIQIILLWLTWIHWDLFRLGYEYDSFILSSLEGWSEATFFFSGCRCNHGPIFLIMKLAFKLSTGKCLDSRGTKESKNRKRSFSKFGILILWFFQYWRLNLTP